MKILLLVLCFYQRIYLVQAFYVLKFEIPVERYLVDYLKIKITDNFIRKILKT